MISQAGHQLRYQSLLLESDFFSGSAFGAVIDIVTMRNDMDDDLKALRWRKLCEGAIPCLFRINDIGDARHPSDAHHHVEVIAESTLCELACSVILYWRVPEQALIQSSSSENSPSAPSARMIPIVVTL